MTPLLVVHSKVSDGLRIAPSCPSNIARCFLRNLSLPPSRQRFLLMRTLGNDHAALPGGLVRKLQLPSYLVCSDKEQNLPKMRREPQLAKPRDFHPSHTRMLGSVPLLTFLCLIRRVWLRVNEKSPVGWWQKWSSWLSMLPPRPWLPHSGTGTQRTRPQSQKPLPFRHFWNQLTPT